MKQFASFLIFIACTVHLYAGEQNKFIHLKNDWEYKSEKSTEWIKCKELKDIVTLFIERKELYTMFSSAQLLKYKELASQKWFFRKTFTLDSNLVKNYFATLMIQKPDVGTSFKLNGNELGTSENAFIPFEAEIHKLLKPGENIFEFVIEPFMKYSSSIRYPAENDPNSVFIRKNQMEFGWDIFPELHFRGINGDIGIEFWTPFRITNTRVTADLVSDEFAWIYMMIEVDSKLEGTFHVNWKSTNSDFSGERAFVSKGKGKEWFRTRLPMKDPKRWWPSGYGEPFLYEMIATAHQDKYETKKAFSFGLRETELVQKKDKAGGESFTIRINKQPVFVRGTNYVPVNYDLKNTINKNYCCNGPNYKDLFERMNDLHLNMIRVWGGGEYADEEFYEMADRYGIMVWQDFMFAGSMYPTNSLEENLKKELTYQIERIRKHPSVVLWCGNNEIDVAWKNWGWQKKFNYSVEDSTSLKNEYDKFFLKTIPSLLSELDSSTPYIPSSPISNWGNNQDFITGNNHYWGVWHGEEWFEKYNEKVARFMTEYGFPALPYYESLGLSVEKGAVNLSDKNMRNHLMRSYKGYGLIEKYMKHYYSVPKKTDDIIYISQLLQYDALRTAIHAHRRRMKFCMGSMFWQLNDAWPGITWSVVDYTNQPKAGYFAVKNSFRDIILSASEFNKTIDIFCVNDLAEDLNAELNITVMKFDGTKIYSRKENIIAGKRNSNIILSIPKDSLLQKHDTNSVVLVLSLMKDDKTIAEDLHYFTTPGKLKLKKPQITIELNEKRILIIHSNTLVKNLRIGFKNKYHWWENNYCDILPGKYYEFIPDQQFISGNEYNLNSLKEVELKYYLP